MKKISQFIRYLSFILLGVGMFFLLQASQVLDKGVFLEEVSDTVPSTKLIVEEIIIILLFLSPWVGLIIYSIVKKYRVSFYVDDLTCFSMAKLKKGETIPYPTLPNTGKEFLGWYYYGSFDRKFEEKVMPDKNLKLIAKWEDSQEKQN